MSYEDMKRELRSRHEELKILKRHPFTPSTEIYHLTDDPDSIIESNILYVGAGGMLSLTANPHLKYVIPDRTERKFRLVLDWVKLKADFKEYLFPVYYFTDYEWYETEPPNWLVSYYRGKKVEKLGQDTELWNTAPLIYLGEDLFSKESEWKCTRTISPLKKYLVRVEAV